MKKQTLIFLALVVIFGNVSASSWRTSSLTITPSGEIVEQLSVDSAQPDTLRYDTGPYYILTNETLTDIWGTVRFTPPGDFELHSIYMWMGNPNAVSDGVQVSVHADDGEGYPGDIISGPYSFDGPLWLDIDSWLDVDLDQPYLQFSPGKDFHVVFGPAPYGTAEEGWFFAVDKGENTEDRTGYAENFEGPWWHNIPNDLIVRAGGEGIGLAELALTECYSCVGGTTDGYYFHLPGTVLSLGAKVENTGITRADSYEVVWTVENSQNIEIFRDSATFGPLAWKEETTHVCPSNWTAEEVGYYTVTATVNLNGELMLDDNSSCLEQGVLSQDFGWMSFNDGEGDMSFDCMLGYGWSHAFLPPAYPAKVDSVRLGVNAATDTGRVYLVNFTDINSRTTLWEYKGHLNEGVNTFDISGEDISISDGYIGLACLSGALLLDNDPPLARVTSVMPYVSCIIGPEDLWRWVEAGDFLLDIYCSFPGIGVIPSGGKNHTTFAFEGNYPNPFNNSTRFAFSLPTGSEVSLKIYDIRGQVVAVLAEGLMQSGSYEATFDASDFATGVYIYHLDAGQFSASGKMVLLK